MNMIDVEKKIIHIRNQAVLLDSDVAALYGVETKRINEAVRNNPEKFPEGYLITVSRHEKMELVENFDRLLALKHSTVSPKAFTEKGLYMLATILKSAKAVETTLSIIETFTKIREMSRIVQQLPMVKENSPQQQSMMQKAGNLISDLIVPETTKKESEASIELNLALVKFKYSRKSK